MSVGNKWQKIKTRCNCGTGINILPGCGWVLPVAAEYIRVLKPGRHCAILMVDARKHAHFIPITLRDLQSFIQLHALNKYFLVKPDAKSFRDCTGYKCRGNIIYY
jgi:DNA modification methylase